MHVYKCVHVCACAYACVCVCMYVLGESTHILWLLVDDGSVEAGGLRVEGQNQLKGGGGYTYMYYSCTRSNDVIMKCT
jgi:hypothetical protein